MIKNGIFFLLLVTVGCLVMHQRYKKRYEKYLTFSRELSNPESGNFLFESIFNVLYDLMFIFIRII